MRDAINVYLGSLESITLTMKMLHVLVSEQSERTVLTYIEQVLNEAVNAEVIGGIQT